MIEKSQFPPGPWHDEPDFHTWVEHGLECKLRRHSMGHWCGYVGVPKDHIAHGLTYYPMNDWYEVSDDTKFWRRHVSARAEVAIQEITVHGGLTYAETEEDGLHWFGFDCAHAWDLVPGVQAHRGTTTDRYRDFEYVTNETRNLAKQLAAIKPLPSLAELGVKKEE